ncbi:MAG: hypothetical protein GY697_10370 [Desulfobacterales bacterium]|nr:hypothetical protein [Desulfobacterales bacterium]
MNKVNPFKHKAARADRIPKKTPDKTAKVNSQAGPPLKMPTDIITHTPMEKIIKRMTLARNSNEKLCARQM